MQLAYETNWPDGPHRAIPPHDLYVRLDVSLNLDESVVASLPAGSTPILFYPGHDIAPARLSSDALARIQEAHEAWAQALTDQGFSRMVLAADNDGAYQKMLSPRFSEKPIAVRMGPLLETFSKLQAICPQTSVILCVEELAPGGLDATDGIMVSKALGLRGLREIIATAGTKDFPPLYNRRRTQEKPCAEEDFYSQEPHLASSLWLKQHTDFLVYHAGFFDDEVEAQRLAQEIGLVGIIQRLPN